MAVEKKAKKLNVIDIVAVIALLALAAALVYAFVSGMGISGERVHVRYVLEADMLQTEFCEKPQREDLVYDGKTGSVIGSIEALSSVPAKHEGVDKNGAFVSTEVSGYSTLYLTVEADARKTPQGYVMGDAVVNIGKDVEVRLAALTCKASCISMEIVEE